MSPMNWSQFDADSPDPKITGEIATISTQMLSVKGIDKNNRSAIREFAAKKIEDYNSGLKQELNETIGVHTFRPSEFNSDSSNDISLNELINWLPKQSFEWKNGSRTVQLALKKFPSAGSVRIEGGREYVELDNLVTILNRRVAIEIETSNNLDNGFWTLRQAVQLNKADYGVMIVPWTAEGQGRADEGKALGRIDREFGGSQNVEDGPIYRIAIIRRLDIYRLMLNN